MRHVAEDAVSVDDATKILHLVPPYIGRYAVTHLVEPQELIGLIDSMPIDALQVHEAVDPSVLVTVREARPGVRLLKAVHVRSSDVPDWVLYADVVDAVILDSVDQSTGRIGGTGKVHDWSTSAIIAEHCVRPVVLAGGLTPGNVSGAVRTVRPWAVNVNSGVETDARKDADRIREFVEAANCSSSTKD